MTAELFLREGRDEMNLVEYPFAVLSKRSEAGQKTIELTWQDKDRQGQLVAKSWLVTGSDKWGLPTADGEKVYVALMALTKENGFKDQTIKFRAVDIIARLGWPKRSGESYRRLKNALQTLKGINIYATNVFWDNKIKNCHPMRAFSIIANYDHYGDEHKTIHVKWDDVLWASFQASYIKTLDLGLWFSLGSSITRRLYRFLDKRFYHSPHFSVELRELALRHLGMSQNYYPSAIKRKLTPACEELVEQGWLKSFKYQKKGRGEVVIFNKNQAPQLITEPLEHPEALVEALVERGISISVAKQLYEKYPARTKHQIEYFDFEKEYYPHLVQKNPGGYLRKRIEEDWAPHGKYVSAEEKERQVKQRAEQEKRREYQYKVEEWESWQKQTAEENIKGELWLWEFQYKKEHKNQSPPPDERAAKKQELIEVLPTDEEKYQEIFGKALRETEKLF